MIEPHPPMPPLGPEDCSWLEGFDHFCEKPRHHRGTHRCPCGLETR